jgi:hypothetical protein
MQHNLKFHTRFIIQVKNRKLVELIFLDLGLRRILINILTSLNKPSKTVIF